MVSGSVLNLATSELSLATSRNKKKKPERENKEKVREHTYLSQFRVSNLNKIKIPVLMTLHSRISQAAIFSRAGFYLNIVAPRDVNQDPRINPHWGPIMKKKEKLLYRMRQKKAFTKKRGLSKLVPPASMHTYISISA